MVKKETHDEMVLRHLQSQPDGISVHFCPLNPKQPITTEDVRLAKELYEEYKQLYPNGLK